MTVLDYQQAGSSVLETVAAYEPLPIGVGAGGEPVRINGHVVVGDYFALFGLMAYKVTRRTREIGIRMALRASPRRVLALIVSDGLKLAAVAVSAGAVCAVPVAVLLSEAVFGLRVSDLGSFSSAALLLVAVTAMAAFVPGRRAAHIRPLDALRAE